MSEIKLSFRKGPSPGLSGNAPCCCTPEPGAGPGPGMGTPAWVVGNVQSPVGPVPKVSTSLTWDDRWKNFKCRVSSFRDNYHIPPGLYAIGEPGADSDVFVSANYKFSFDMLRREMVSLSAWLLVLDTKGINVWCAAGKGSFGTSELIERMSRVQLEKVVTHRRIILPQLGATGVSNFKVRRETGFKVYFGPVRAGDIPGFLKAGYRATRQMRMAEFGLKHRLALTPMEIIPVLKGKYPVFALAVLAVFGLEPPGFLFRDALVKGLPFLLLGLLSVFSGAFLIPVLLPLVPGRSFALKGFIIGMLTVVLATSLFNVFDHLGAVLLAASYIFFPMASSYIALQFTGSTTFTGMSGVKKELKFAIPVYLASAAITVALLIIYKLMEWRVI